MSTFWVWHSHAIKISQQLHQPTLGSTRLSLNCEAWTGQGLVRYYQSVLNFQLLMHYIAKDCSLLCLIMYPLVSSPGYNGQFHTHGQTDGPAKFTESQNRKKDMLIEKKEIKRRFGVKKSSECIICVYGIVKEQD